MEVDRKATGSPIYFKSTTREDKMTDEDLNTGDPSKTPEFGSNQGSDGDQNKQTDGVTLSQEDIDSLKKSNSHAQEHIKRIEEENKQFREDLRNMQSELQKAATIDDLMTTYRQPESDDSPGTTSPQLDEEALLTKLKQEVFNDMSYAQQLDQENQNWDTVEAELKQRHGEGWASYVDERAQELGMTNDQMEGFAKTSPKAFMELVGGSTRSAQPTQGSLIPPQGGMDDTEAEMRRIAHARKDLSTAEGREANAKWQDPEWQKKYRASVLKDVDQKGLTRWR